MQNTYTKGTAFFILGVLAAHAFSAALLHANDVPPVSIETLNENQASVSENLIISDEVDLTSAPEEEQIISDEAALVDIPEEIMVELVSVDESWDSIDAILATLWNKDYITMYAQAKDVFEWKTWFSALADAWEALSQGATQEDDVKLTELKRNFLEAYLELTQGKLDFSLDDFNYEGVSKDEFEKSIMSYLDMQGADEYQYSNARKLAAMVEIYNSVPETQKADMQKSLVTQFGRVIK